MAIVTFFEKGVFKGADVLMYQDREGREHTIPTLDSRTALDMCREPFTVWFRPEDAPTEKQFKQALHEENLYLARGESEYYSDEPVPYANREQEEAESGDFFAGVDDPF